MNQYVLFVGVAVAATINPLELSLAAAPFLKQEYKKPIFWLGISFHLLIALFMGITSFSIAMIAALILNIRNPQEIAGLAVQVGDSQKLKKLTHVNLENPEESLPSWLHEWCKNNQRELFNPKEFNG